MLVADLLHSGATDVSSVITAKGGKSQSFFGDLSDERDAQSYVNTAIQFFGGLDVLVSSAGVFIGMGEIDTRKPETIYCLVRMNTRPGFLVTKYALPDLRKTRGNIVYIGSISGITGSSELGPYGASKAFVHSLMMGVAQEQAHYGVRANVVAQFNRYLLDNSRCGWPNHRRASGGVVRSQPSLATRCQPISHGCRADPLTEHTMIGMRGKPVVPPSQN